MTESTYIEKLQYRYATKQFNPDKKLSHPQLKELKTAIQLSASSYGLQPYEVIIIENKELRQKLKAASWDQPQITDASHLFVFCANTNIDSQYLDRYLKNISETRNIPLENLNGMRDMITNTVLQFDNTTKLNWAEKQAYLALGNLLSAAAHFGYDVCPMEGFDSAKYNEILGLKSKNLHASVVATVGYRSENDDTQHASKVRKPKNELFTEL